MDIILITSGIIFFTMWIVRDTFEDVIMSEVADGILGLIYFLSKIVFSISALITIVNYLTK